MASVFLVLASGMSISLGGLVLLRSPRQSTSRRFALLSLTLALWSLGVLAIIHSPDKAFASEAIKITFAIAAFLPATFYHFIRSFPAVRQDKVPVSLYVLYAGGAALALGTRTPYYLHDVTLSDTAPPAADYGPVFYAYSALVAMSMVVSFTDLFLKARKAVGIQRRQVDHVIMAIFLSTGLASFTNILAPAWGIKNLEIFGPCFMVLMMAIFAYSMIRYHLLDIWILVSRATVYAVVTAFVVAVFMTCVSVVHWVFSGGGRAADLMTTLLAATIIVFFLQPLRERVQLLLNRAVLYRHYDAERFIERITRSAGEIVKLEHLLDALARDINNTLGVRDITVLLVSEKTPRRYVSEYRTGTFEVQPEYFDDLNFLEAYVRDLPGPVSVHELAHTRQSDECQRVVDRLEEFGAQLCVPLRTTKDIVGFILLGAKSSQDIFTLTDLKVFSTVARPLATAIENARLYKRLEALNLHLERIMKSMQSGVIAVDELGVVTTVNVAAVELMGPIAPGTPMKDLEPRVAALLRRTLEEHRSFSDMETVITAANGEPTPVVMSSSEFRTATADTLGGMVLIHDMTQIKRLEASVQRADRLTSIGTMAAGMAHEIKNPLQSIKTFTQLLPDRYEDQDFRKTFSEVVPPEVQRIDAIVTRLLDFARPKPACFEPQDVQGILRDVLALTENQVRKADITVHMDFPPENRPIMGDDQQLHQLFLNLVLNAIDAMRESPERRLTISMGYTRLRRRPKASAEVVEVPCARIMLTDTGCGIEEYNVQHLFTPFFTTKSHGSGLGLCVANGIVTEHEGDIDLKSAPGRGTTFSVSFPLAQGGVAAERVKL
jgi:two-component system nitrogen regulation sensor histidine kinase GlnL